MVLPIAYCVFRASAGTGDPSDGVSNLGEIYSTGNPKVGGVYSQGWIATNTNMGDDGTYADKHVRGFGSSPASNDASTWRISDLVIGHTYRVYMAQALLFANNACGFNIYSDAARTTTLYAGPALTVTAPQIMDINGTMHASAAAILAAQGYQDIVATTVNMFVCKNANTSRMNYFGIQDLTSAVASPSRSLLGVGT